MSAILWLGGVLIALWLLGLLLARHIQGVLLLVSGSARLATSAYDLLVLPGVVLHELSHAVCALLLGIRVMRINLFQFRSLDDPRQGEVVVAKADPLRMSIVGAAPLLGGVAVLLLLVSWIDPPALSFDRTTLNQLLTLLRDPLTALGLYLLFAVANTMFPSEADRQAWWIVGALAVVGGVVLVALDVQPAIPPAWITRVAQQADRLVVALLPIVLIDVLILALVILLEVAVGRVRGRRVLYRSSRS